MASFVKLDGDNKVVAAVSVHNDVAPTEEAGALFLNKLYNTSDVWKQTSYNTRGGIHYEPNSNTPSADQSKAFRKNHAGIGYIYDAGRDAFIEPQPYPSWTLNESSCRWEAPNPWPEETPQRGYYWDEAAYQADNTQGWVLMA